MTKKTVTSKMGKPVVEQIDEYAEEEGISRSQAIEELSRKALKVEDKGEIVISDGGTELTDQLDSVESRVRSQGEYQEYLNITLAVSLLWFVVYFALGLSPLWTGVTGLPLVGVLSLLLYKNHTGGSYE